MIRRIKHKLAWHFRKWANKLEPAALGLNPQRGEIMYMGKPYQLTPLRLEVKFKDLWGHHEDMGVIYSTAAKHIGEAASTRVEIVDKEYVDGRATLQLLILEPLKNENKRN